MSNIKIEQLPKCEQDIVEIQELIDSGNFQEIEYDLTAQNQRQCLFRFPLEL